MATYTDNYNLVKPTMAESADIRTINGNMDSVDNIMHATQVSLAPAYDQNETYNNGDIVMYEFLMYECLDDDVTGTWDATKWQRTTAGEHGGGGGGSDVEITPTLQSGTKIADFEIDGVSGALYAPSGGGGASSQGVYIDKLIFDTYVAGDGTYALLESIDNYDALLVCGYGASGDNPSNFIMSQFVTKAEFYTKKIALLATVTGSTRRIFIEFPDSTHVKTSSKEGDISLRFIYGIKMSGNYFSPIIYSTEEREVGVWVDNKPLYQKTLIANYTSGVSSGAHVVESIADIEIVKGFGSYVESSGYVYTMPYAEGTGTSFYYYGGDVVLSIGSSVSFASGTLYLTIQYTKDSDTAGSGSYGSLGIPMEHYDDTERVVGTYFGDTLYKKTIRQTNIDGNPSDWTLIETMSGVGKYVKSEASFKRGNMIYSQYYISIMFDNSTKGLYYFIREMGSGARGNFEVTVYYTKSTT